MSFSTPSDRTSTEAIAALRDKLLGYPSSAHVNMGGGPWHEPVDGVHTRSHAPVRKHPTQDLYTTELGNVRSKLDSPEKDSLSLAEQTALDTAEKSSVGQLTADWTPTQP